LLGHKNGRYVPFVFFLLPSKSGECYTNMFRHLIEDARDFGHNFLLTSIHLDFEDAVLHMEHNARFCIQARYTADKNI
jgi:hypothetical protein